MILDDAVVDDGESCAAVEMRVSVHVRHPPVCRPTGMAQAYVTGWESRLGMADLPYALLDHHVTFACHGNAPGVIASILQLLEAAQYDVRRIRPNAHVT